MAISVARRNLFRQRTRLLLSTGGVGFAIMLMLLVLGLYSAWRTQATQYVRAVPADVWVAQAGTPGDLFHSVSLIPLAARDALAAQDGVRSVDPFLGRQVMFRHRGKEIHFFLVGVDPARPVTAPRLAEGKRVPGPGEVVVDEVFARQRGIRLGDAVTVKGERLRVAGLSRETNAIISQFVFVDMPTAVKILQSDVARFAPGLSQFAGSITNYLLVRADGDPEQLVDRIETQAAGLKPMTRDGFAEENVRDLEEGFLPILFVLVLIAFGVGTAVIALTIYTATIEKSKEYGVLKAIGFSNRRLFGVVAEQSLVTTLLGFAGGLVLMFAVSRILGAALPMFSTRITFPMLAGTFGLAVLMGAASAAIPTRPIASLDPAQVFRA